MLTQFTDAYMRHQGGNELKPHLHRAATFVPPLSDQKNDRDTQWSPKPRKFCFCVTAAARPFCLPWITKTAVVAQQVAQRRQSGGRTIVIVAQGLPWLPNGGTVVATVVAQWTLLVDQRRHNGGTREAEAWLKLIKIFTTVCRFYGADPCASILRPRRWMCFLPASFERHVSDLSATVLNTFKTSRQSWRPWRGLNVLCATLERPRQTFGLLCAFNGDRASFAVAQGRHKGRSPCV